MQRRKSSRSFAISTISDGVIYEIVPSADSIVVAADQTSVLFSGSASFYRRDGQGARSAYSCYATVYKRTGNTFTRIQYLSSKATSITMSNVGLTTYYDALVIFIFDSSYTETSPLSQDFLAKVELPVLKNGNTGDSGDDAPYYIKEYARSKSRSSYSGSNIDTSVGTSGWASTAPSATPTYPYIWERSIQYDPNTGAYSDYSYVCLTGEGGTGVAGHVGRMYYYAGEWSSSKVYYFEKTQAPYVKASDGNFYMLDFGAYPDIQNSDNTRNVDNEFNPTTHDEGDPWTLMSSEQQYYIAKAFFGEFAQFGSAIISGDFMFSTNGCIDDTDYINGADWKERKAYALFVGDPDVKGFSVSTSKSIGTSNVNLLGSTTVPLEAGEMLLMKLVITTITDTTRLRIYNGSSNVNFEYSTPDGTTSWSTTTNNYLNLSVGTYYIRYIPTTSCSCTIRAYKTATPSKSMAYSLERFIFKPNWWVDLYTGKMSGARGNFVVKPDGGVSIAKDKFTVDENGDVVANNITIKGSLMYHNVGMSDPSVSEQGAQLFTMYDANGNVVTINGSATVAKTVLNYDTFILTGAKRNYTIFLPPAVLFPGTKIKIVNGTYSGSTGDLTRDLSTITLSVVHRSDTEPGHEDGSNEEMNSLSTAIPFDISNGGIIFGYRTEMEYKVYGSVELISMLNPESPNYTGTLKNYVWMIVDAKE